MGKFREIFTETSPEEEAAVRKYNRIILINKFKILSIGTGIGVIIGFLVYLLVYL